MKQLRYTLVLLAWLCCQHGLVFAGGWTQPKGQGFFKLSEQVTISESLFLKGGNKFTIPKLSKYTTSLYGEYGLVNRLTLVAYMPFLQHITLDAEDIDIDPVTSIADGELGVRLGLFARGATVVSLQVMAGLPLGDADQPVGLYTGDGEFNQRFALQIGHSLYPTPAYLKGEIGYNNRENNRENPEKDFADELRYALEAGYIVGDRLGITLWLRGSKATGKRVEDFTRHDIQYISFGPEISYYLNEIAGITVGMSRFARGYNVLDAPAWEIGLFLKI